MLKPDRAMFAADPFGYSVLAWHTWDTARAVAGYSANPKDFPTSADLKLPVLWLAQAHALSQAALVVLKEQPGWEHMPLAIRSMCDSQYCAAGLMLVGYSLEICLKGMLIRTKGIAGYTAEEKQLQHHKLGRLAELVPGLSDKDEATLRVLTHFIEWAGRYPDPGSGRDAKVEEIFSLSERHQISGRDLFGLASRVMGHAEMVANRSGTESLASAAED